MPDSACACLTKRPHGGYDPGPGARVPAEEPGVCLRLRVHLGSPPEGASPSRLVTQSCPTLCHPMDCSPTGSSVHGILRARILEWLAVPSSRRSCRPQDRTCISYVSGTGRRILYQSVSCSVVSDSLRPVDCSPPVSSACGIL